MPQALPSFVALAVAASLASADVSAMGFGSVRSATLLGQPLNIAVPVRLEADEELEAECVRAEVQAGDDMIDRDSVRVRVTRTGDSGERLIRVTTLGAINEPVVTLTLTAGCPPRISRKFVTFADPPEFRMAQAEPSQAPSSALAAQPAAVPAPPADAVPASPTGSSETRAASTPTEPRSAATTQARPAPRRRVARPEGAPARRAVATAPSAPRAAPAAPAAQPRLKLDVVEPLPATATASAPPTSDAQAVAAEAASAARTELAAAQMAASAADARMRTMEAELAKLRADAQANREALTQLRSRAPVTTLGSSYLPWLIGLLALLVLLAIGLGWRLIQLSRPPVRSGTGERWYGPSEMPESMHGEVKSPAPAAEMRAAVAGAAVASAPAPHGETRPQSLAVASHRHREVTVEEQIDLEQQADFFIALGQDDAAIDLLLTHLRGTGGTSPMPYLKLLDIYRRCGDHDAYDRTRIRFNQRFNGVAPAWSDDPSAGRSLEEYPVVLARMQRVWWTPLDAMAELESMLFRKGEGAELFDLPAYLDVLCLYQVARDLHQHEQDAGQAAAWPVDVLLPIGDGASADPMSVRHVEMDRTATLRGPAAKRREFVSLDLDLSGEEEHVFPFHRRRRHEAA